jgi:hypothetical protein
MRSGFPAQDLPRQQAVEKAAANSAPTKALRPSPAGLPEYIGVVIGF